MKYNSKSHRYPKKSSTYTAWVDMKQRCSNPKTHSYRWYGARGVKVCDRWLDSFTNFLEDMGAKPDGRSLDRIDNYGDYEPTNCRWATHDQQVDNTRRNVICVVEGQKVPLSLIVRTKNLSAKEARAIYKRIKVHGWSVDRAFTEPIRQYRERV